jgi:hypothetical protein
MDDPGQPSMEEILSRVRAELPQSAARVKHFDWGWFWKALAFGVFLTVMTALPFFSATVRYWFCLFEWSPAPSLLR